MQNQTQTSNQHFTNAAFATLFDSITAKLPSLTFWAIIFSYVATAGLNCWAIALPLYLSVPLALAIQSLRLLCVFTPFLNPSGRAGHLPEVIAIGASLLALFELSFSLRAMGEADDNFWSLFLFGAAILVLSMVLELQFISAGKKAFGLVGEKRTGQTGAVTMQQAQQVEVSEDAKAIQDENTFLRNQVAQLQNGLGNGSSKVGRPKKQIPAELLNNASMNGNGNGKH